MYPTRHYQLLFASLVASVTMSAPADVVLSVSPGTIYADQGVLGKIDVGDTVKFDISVTNQDGTELIYVDLTDQLPIGLTNLTILSLPGGEVTESTADRLVVRNYDVPVNQTRTMRITAQISPAVTNGQTLYNSVELDADFDAIPDLMASSAVRNIINTVQPGQPPDYCSMQTTITAEAGTGAAGWMGDGTAATSARLWTPTQLCVDASNNLYIADYSNHVVRKVTRSSGLISTVAGIPNTPGYSGDGGQAQEALLNLPSDVFIQGSYLYIAEMGNSTVRRVNLDTGIITTIAGTGSTGFSGDDQVATGAKLNRPRSVAVDVGGNIYIADTFNYRIRKIDPLSGMISTVAGNGTCAHADDGAPAASSPVEWVMDLAISNNTAHEGQLFFTVQNGYNQVRYIDASGSLSTYAGRQGQGDQGDCGPSQLADLRKPYGLCFDTKGNLIIADQASNKVRLIDGLSGMITTLAGTGDSGSSGDNGPGKLARLNSPCGVVVGTDGILHIADSANNRIRRMNLNSFFQPAFDTFPGMSSDSDNVKTVVGTGTAGFNGDGRDARTAQISYPGMMAFDAKGNLVFCDRSNHRVRIVYKSNWIVRTLAGTGSKGYSGDAGKSEFAKLSFPTGIAVGPDGSLYFSEQGNHVVRKINPSGAISTVAGKASPGQTPLADGQTILATNCYLNEPEGLAVSGSTLFIADKNNNAVYSLDLSTGHLQRLAGNYATGRTASAANALQQPLTTPRGIKFDAATNSLVVTASGTNQICRIYLADKRLEVIAGNGLYGTRREGSDYATASPLLRPVDVALSALASSFYIVEQAASQVRLVDNGLIFPAYGTKAGTYSPAQETQPASQATFNNPSALEMSPDGLLFISDRENQRIRAM